MSLSSLQDDLLQEFRAERTMVYEQLNVLDPMATALHKPAAQRLISSGVLILFEIVCYLISLGGIAFMFLMNKIYPFYLLSDMFYNSTLRNEVGMVNLTSLNIAIYAIISLAVILFFVIARMCRAIRLKNGILHTAGKDIKFIVAQYLKRKASIEAIEQRHMLDVPGSVVEKTKVNEVPNPGYDGNL